MIEKFLAFSEKKSAVHFVIPEDTSLTSPIDYSDIDNALSAMGVGHYYQYQSNIDEITAAINNGDITALNNVMIAQCLDAQLVVHMQDDEMKASMTVTGAYGGHPVRGPEIIQALTENGITKGVKKEALKVLLLKGKDLAPGETYSDVIAVGREAVEGQDTQFEALVPNIHERVLQPQETDDGHVDMRDLGNVISVKQNTPLMRRIPATQGINGKTITGKIITATPGTDIPFQLYPGSSLAPTDPNLLIADIDGSPLINKSGVGIDNLLTLKTVNATSGHVSFEGSIFIQQDIESGMKVTATGSITVGGFIENAEVTAKHDITVMHGIIGRPVQDGEPLTCIVSSEGTITSKLAQNAHLMAHQDVHITLHANHCLIESLGSIFVIDKAERNGTISGGNLVANGAIKTANLGIEGGAYTKVQAFHDFETQKENLHLLQKQINEVKTQLIKISNIHMEQQPNELAEKILRSKEKSEQDLQVLGSKLQREQITFNNGLKENTIFVTNKIFPRVDVQFNTHHLVTKREYSPSKISYSGYEIDVEPIMIKKK
ncbi:DUF342 domain-containing protein [Aliivibrio fischeri]|uniref:DUF342 domain-containing protein n=1 Tax=Aliivibrio fischeri TaxID=668 RepID=UPI0012D91C6E|nr:FapA family protein [Aliivibrio fischeri]MUK61964.1 DUF342 domain-containing protein [Aliivibrio fischeri]MUK69416.1 DUF342 domain-containing protein [Aliivibrio fischeri]MUK74100.1 DUF342 domain-containing protein [Aliivibrio fischeri]MUK75283.1 DUF342 domain-containing protein [Aliivibrio fischeri]MUL21765.1 DUF342 domain-containing protein [Aliivibrio fischeri]